MIVVAFCSTTLLFKYLYQINQQSCSIQYVAFSQNINISTHNFNEYLVVVYCHVRAAHHCIMLSCKGIGLTRSVLC